jgi:hypothetical protein
MNTQQTKYVMGRIDGAVADKLKELSKVVGCNISKYDRRYHDMNGLAVNQPDLTIAEIKQGIKNAGGLKILSTKQLKEEMTKDVLSRFNQDCNFRNHYAISDAVIINKKEVYDAMKVVQDNKRDAITERGEAIVERAERLKDEIMLGDSEEALKLLEKFRKEKI